MTSARTVSHSSASWSRQSRTTTGTARTWMAGWRSSAPPSGRPAMDFASRRTYVERIPDITIAAHGRRGAVSARIDYDAYSDHSSELREVMDSRRRNQLASYAGMVQFSLRTSQVMRYSEFEQEIEWIRISLGQRRKDGSKKQQGETQDRRIALWQRVVSGERDCYTGLLVESTAPRRGRS